MVTNTRIDFNRTNKLMTLTLDELIAILTNLRVNFDGNTPVVTRSVIYNDMEDKIPNCIRINNIKKVKHLNSNKGNDYIVINIVNTDIISE